MSTICPLGTVSNVIPLRGMESENPLRTLTEQRQGLFVIIQSQVYTEGTGQDITPREHDPTETRLLIGYAASTGQASLRYSAVRPHSSTSWILWKTGSTDVASTRAIPKKENTTRGEEKTKVGRRQEGEPHSSLCRPLQLPQ